MKNITKLISYFLLSSFLVLFISAPNESFVNYENKSSVEYQSQFVADFYDSSAFNRKFVEPVVKINMAILTPFGEETVSSATGFSIKYDKSTETSYVITNHHFCVQEQESIFPSRFFFERSDTLMSTTKQYDNGNLLIVDMDPTKDLCLLKTYHKIPPANLADKDYVVEQMERVISVGAPNGIFPILLDSTVSNLFERDILPPHMQDGPHLLMISDVIYGGQSGSPVFNKKGQVIGVLFMGFETHNGESIYGSLAIPIKDVHDFLDKHNIL